MRQRIVTWSGNIPGFGDARTDGRVVVSVPGSRVVTDAGDLEQPNGHAALYVTLPPSGPRIACAWSDGGPDRAKEWTGSAWADLGLCCGTNPVIYSPDGVLHISHCEAPQGAIGWRYIDASGRFVTCEETYADRTHGIYEFTAWPDIKIGQGDEGALVWFPDLGRRRLTFEALRSTGKLRNIRARRTGNDFAITVVDYDQHLTTVTFATLTELRAMPAVTLPPPTVEAWPRKLWIAPFWSHSEQFGDTPLAQHAGNAICVTPDGRDPGTSIVRELNRIRPLGLPLIVASGDYEIPREHEASTVAWWCAGCTADGLGRAVVRGLARPERPVIAYLDSEQPAAWPTMRQSWMTDKVWPSLQAYRWPGEALGAFDARMTAMLDKVERYGRPLVLTPRFDDFNGDSTIARTLECMPLYERWIRDYRIVGLMPFADRRGVGIAKDARLHAWAMAFLKASPGRPDWFEYWGTTPDAPKVTILNFYPSNGKAPLTVTAIRSLSGGQADRVIWRQRKQGAAAWTIVANNAATDADHHFKFEKPGVYELGVDVTGPGGMDGTSKPRVVTVTT